MCEAQTTTQATDAHKRHKGSANVIARLIGKRISSILSIIQAAIPSVPMSSKGITDVPVY